MQPRAYNARIRLGKEDDPVRRLTPIRAIRAKCIDCSGGSRSEVKHCTVETYPLWPYRHGKRPRIDSEEASAHVAMGKLSIKRLSEVGAVQTNPEA